MEYLLRECVSERIASSCLSRQGGIHISAFLLAKGECYYCYYKPWDLIRLPPYMHEYMGILFSFV
jgi:hypothetical protein